MVDEPGPPIDEDIRIERLRERLGTFATFEEAAAAFEREHRVINGVFSQCEAR